VSSCSTRRADCPAWSSSR